MQRLRIVEGFFWEGFGMARTQSVVAFALTLMAAAGAMAIGCSSTTDDDSPVDTADGSADGDDTNSADACCARPATAKIYATIVSHNEQPTGNAPCQAVYASKESYLANRALLLKFAKGVIERGATYDQQNDYNFIDLVSQYDTDSSVNADTEGMNVLKYIHTKGAGKIAIDVHHHPAGGVGYADVAYRLNQLGIEDNGVVGGFLFYPEANAETEAMRAAATDGVAGTEHPEKKWYPKLLWGGGTAGHTGDSEVSGVWRPKSNADFYTDDPSSPLPNVGSSYDQLTAGGLLALIDQAKAGTLVEGKLYTAAFMVNQCEMTEDSIASAFAILDQVNEAVAGGYVEWHTLNQTVDDWKSKFASEPFTVVYSTGADGDAGGMPEGGKIPLEGG